MKALILGQAQGCMHYSMREGASPQSKQHADTVRFGDSQTAQAMACGIGIDLRAYALMLRRPQTIEGSSHALRPVDEPTDRLKRYAPHRPMVSKHSWQAYQWLD